MIMRNQMAMAPQILTQGQQRIQGVPAQFEPRFMERLVHDAAAPDLSASVVEAKTTF